MKVVVDISGWLYDAMMGHREPIYSQSLGDAVRDGTPLDDVKAEIANLDRHKENYSCVFNRPDLIDLVVDDVLHILDNIGKAESEE